MEVLTRKRVCAIAWLALQLALPLACSQATGDVRLVAERGVANWVLGRPQIFINGTWQQICAAGFEARDSDVVCRQLGHGAGAVLPFFNVPPDASGNVRGPPLPVGVLVAGCDGTEEALLECRTGSRDFLPWEFSERTGVITGCMTRSNPGLGIACVAREEQGEELALRLVGGEAMPDTAFGVPEIFHSGAWGSFCNGDIYRVLEYQFFLNLPYTQVAATKACKQLGYTFGFFNKADGSIIDVSMIRPPWLGQAICDKDAESFEDCFTGLGDTAACGVPMALFCSTAAARERDGEVRLVGGRRAADGSWEYGRVEFRYGGFPLGLQVVEVLSQDFRPLGRRGALVACRDLGYTAGVEAVAGPRSALPGPAGMTDFVSKILCLGGEERLLDCNVTGEPDYVPGPFCSDREACNTALICTTPSGCNTPDAAPSPGAVRLVDLKDTPSGTSPCDEVHFGGVEMFFRDRWGAICGFRDTNFTSEATVVCGQLGFPFGSMFNVEEVEEDDYGFINSFPDNDTIPSSLSWGSVTCNGTEQRLEECSFSGSSDGTFARVRERRSFPCRSILGVVCHRFELAEVEANVLPPLSPA